MNITPAQAGDQCLRFSSPLVTRPSPLFLNRKHNLALNMTLLDHLMGNGGIFQGQHI